MRGWQDSLVQARRPEQAGWSWAPIAVHRLRGRPWTWLPNCPALRCAVAPGLKYAKSHEWALVEGETATVGISDFAQVRAGGRVGAGSGTLRRAAATECALPFL